jgi:hypothetical protein
MSKYWFLWFVTAVTTFLVPELWALLSGRPENTLSAQIWRLERFVPGEALWAWNYFHFLFAGVLLLLDLWLFGHFVFGLWR